MNYSLDDIKIKHLEIVSSHEVDFKKAMVEIFGYKNNFFDRRWLFKKKFLASYDAIQAVRAINISKYSDNTNPLIKVPENLDNISLQARLEIDNAKQKQGLLSDLIIEIVALATFEKHFGIDFDSDCELFKSYMATIKEMPLLQVMSAYNRIEKDLDRSNKFWQKMFMRVKVIDKDFEAVNGPTILGPFGLLSTIKKTIADFNTTYKGAFLLSYALVQNNNLEAACRGYVQEQMTQKKEREMRIKRNTQ